MDKQKRLRGWEWKNILTFLAGSGENAVDKRTAAYVLAVLNTSDTDLAGVAAYILNYGKTQKSGL